MLDLHTHILPFLDDGAETSTQAEVMARLAFDNGTNTIFCTPHQLSAEPIARETLRQLHLLQQRVPEVTFVPGAEVLLCKETMPLIAAHQALPLNGSRYLLCEFVFDEGDSADAFLEQVWQAGYVPIVAHPERYSFFDPLLIRQWKASGVLYQVNARSVVSPELTPVYSRAGWLLKNRLADFVASDAHDHFHRTPVLKTAFEEIRSRYTEVYARRLFEDHPCAVLHDQTI